MILHLLVFLAGGVSGAFLMSLLVSGRREDETRADLHEKQPFSRRNPDQSICIDALAAKSD